MLFYGLFYLITVSIWLDITVGVNVIPDDFVSPF